MPRPLGAILIRNGKIIEIIIVFSVLKIMIMKTRRIEYNFEKVILKIFVFSMIFFLVSCSKESNENQNKTLIGKWTWIQSSGGIAGQIYTPQSTGEMITIEFCDDLTYRQYRNEILNIETKYELKNIEGYNEMFIFYESKPASIITSLENDTLILTDYMDDGYVNVYRKE